MSKRLAKGVRMHIRREKARIRREVFEVTEQERLLKQLNEVYHGSKGN